MPAFALAIYVEFIINITIWNMAPQYILQYPMNELVNNGDIHRQGGAGKIKLRDPIPKVKQRLDPDLGSRPPKLLSKLFHLLEFLVLGPSCSLHEPTKPRHLSFEPVDKIIIQPWYVTWINVNRANYSHKELKPWPFFWCRQRCGAPNPPLLARQRRDHRETSASWCKRQAMPALKHGQTLALLAADDWHTLRWLPAPP